MARWLDGHPGDQVADLDASQSVKDRGVGLGYPHGGKAGVGDEEGESEHGQCGLAMPVHGSRGNQRYRLGHPAQAVSRLPGAREAVREQPLFGALPGLAGADADPRRASYSSRTSLSYFDFIPLCFSVVNKVRSLISESGNTIGLVGNDVGLPYSASHWTVRSSRYIPSGRARPIPYSHAVHRSFTFCLAPTARSSGCRARDPCRLTQHPDVPGSSPSWRIAGVA